METMKMELEMLTQLVLKTSFLTVLRNTDSTHHWVIEIHSITCP